MKMIKKIFLNQTPLKINQKRLMFCLEKDGKSFWYRFTSNQFSPNEVYGFLPYKNKLLLLTDKGILVNCGEFSDWEDRFVSDSNGKNKSIYRRDFSSLQQ